MASKGFYTCKRDGWFGGGAAEARLFVLRPLVVVLLALFTFSGIAAANAETRTLRMYYTHTKESITVTYKKNGRYVQSGLRKLNRFLRDFRRNEPTRMDPELFDVVWEIYKASGSRKPIHVISGYRSPRTNKMLRRRGRKVAKNSQHTRGKALDFFLPDVPVSKLRALGLKAHAGGVGYYRRSFVHIDTGRVRHWPRMSRRQLSRVFPRGRTIHVPSDGRKLKGYNVAAANLRKGRNYDGSRRLSAAKPSLLARIFKSTGDDGDENESGSLRVAKAKPAKKPAPKPAKKPAVAKKKPAKPKGPDPFAVEVAAVSKQKKREAAAAALATKKEEAAALAAKKEEDAAAQAAEQLARVVVPTPRPKIAVPQVTPQPDGSDVAEQTRLSLATPQTPVVTSRPAIDVGTRTGNTVRQPDAQELDALKSRIQTALARQRQLSAAEKATTQLTQKLAKLTVPAPSVRVAPKQEQPIVQAALRPRSISTPTPSWRKSQSKSSTATGKETIPTPTKPKQATRPSQPKQARRVASKPLKPGMIGELKLGDLYGQTVKEWAIASSTRIGPIAALQAPKYDEGTRRVMPGSVYSAGFVNGRASLRADRFSGRALTRVAFARVGFN